MKTKTLDVNQFVTKLNQAELILNELRENVLLFDSELQESIARGEQDIANGKVTICKTEDDLNDFFSSI